MEDAAQAAGDDLEEATEQPAGLGEQPSLTRGSEDESAERRGRRRRRGRRGGRRGRDRDGTREGGEETAPHEGNGAEVPTGEAAAEFEPHPEPAMTERHERQYETASAEQGREQAWQAPETEHRPAPASEPAEREQREPAPSAAREEVSVIVECAGGSDAASPQGMVAAQAAWLTDS